MKPTIVGLLLIGILGSVQAKDPEQVKARAKEASAQQAQETKDSYLKRADQEVREWSDKIQSLEDRSRQSGTRVRQELDRHLASLHTHFDEIRKSFRELSSSGDGAWGSLRRGFEESKQKLNHDYEKAVSSIKKTEKRINGKAEGK